MKKQKVSKAHPAKSAAPSGTQKKSAASSKTKAQISPQARSQAKGKPQLKKSGPKSKAKSGSDDSLSGSIPTSKKAGGQKKILSAASQLRRTTRKMVDDVFLKIVGLRVLERAQEMTRSLSQEGKSKKGRK